MQVFTSQVDPLLVPFLTTTDAVEEANLLASLNAEQVEPVAKRILSYRLHSEQTEPSQHKLDVEEVYHDIQLRLLKRLRALKQEPNDKPIANLQSYVATVARNTCDEYLRRKYPLRRSLKDRIRHCLAQHSEFTLWEDQTYGSVASLAEGKNSQVSDLNPAQLSELLHQEHPAVDLRTVELDRLLTTVFKIANAPVELDQLTTLVAKFLQVEDQAVQSYDAIGLSSVEKVSDTLGDQETTTEQRQLLQFLWDEICELPRRHRVALLLNLRSSRGVNVIVLLPATGIATFEQIAQALEIAPAEFEQLWSDLPLDDLRIAAYLGATRQQVINLRKTARARLARCLSLPSSK